MLIHCLDYCGCVVGAGFAGCLLGGGVVQGRGVDIPCGERGDGALYLVGGGAVPRVGDADLSRTLSLRRQAGTRVGAGIDALYLGAAADLCGVCRGTVAQHPRHCGPCGQPWRRDVCHQRAPVGTCVCGDVDRVLCQHVDTEGRGG